MTKTDKLSVLKGLHILYESFKLDKKLKTNQKTIACLLLKMSLKLKCFLYSELYCRDFGDFIPVLEKNINCIDKFKKQKRLKFGYLMNYNEVKIVDEKPLDICNWITSKIKGKNIDIDLSSYSDIEELEPLRKVCFFFDVVTRKLYNKNANMSLLQSNFSFEKSFNKSIEASNSLVKNFLSPNQKKNEINYNKDFPLFSPIKLYNKKHSAKIENVKTVIDLLMEENIGGEEFENLPPALSLIYSDLLRKVFFKTDFNIYKNWIKIENNPHGANLLRIIKRNDLNSNFGFSNNSQNDEFSEENKMKKNENASIDKIFLKSF